MTEAPESIQTIADRRLSIARETELLHSFVRINLDDDNEFKEEDEIEEEAATQQQQKKTEGKWVKQCVRCYITEVLFLPITKIICFIH